MSNLLVIFAAMVMASFGILSVAAAETVAIAGSDIALKEPRPEIHVRVPF